ncbi:uncharacterized protein LOC143885285 [Tasmannia lanceolata]|uniref:uncharacterized protein LOC143885285 n=1 Tax=Tasmannia lanceolata TaxID=3420 RepID=UPI004062CD69
MDNIGCVPVQTVLRKEKKKQTKDEVDRLKQAEKKKRRLEKALATSAAIRSELEKKKQKKIEEQRRLDEEGAAIAEAVALHVLCDDSDDSCQIVLNKSDGFNPWDRTSNIGLFMGGRNFTKYSVEGLGWVSDAYGYGCKWNDCGIGWSLPPGMFGRDLQAPYFEEKGRGWDHSAGIIAAQAVSSLQIGEDAHAESLTG